MNKVHQKFIIAGIVAILATAFICYLYFGFDILRSSLITSIVGLVIYIIFLSGSYSKRIDLKTDETILVTVENYSKLKLILFAVFLTIVAAGMQWSIFHLSMNFMPGSIFFILNLLIYLIRNWRISYYFSEAGITDANGKVLIDAQKLTEIEFSEKGISFHTINYKNDLVINNKTIKEPSYNALLSFLKNLELSKNAVEEKRQSVTIN